MGIGVFVNTERLDIFGCKNRIYCKMILYILKLNYLLRSFFNKSLVFRNSFTLKILLSL